MELPPNHILVPIDAASAGQPLRICVVVNHTPSATPAPTNSPILATLSSTTPSTNAQNTTPASASDQIRIPQSAFRNPFVLLRSTLDARVYLGAVLDAAGQVREWLEIWVQTTAPLSTAARQTNTDPLTNATLDTRWRAMSATFLAADATACIQTGHEQTHPRPAYIDLGATPPAPWHPATPDGTPITLATNDAELLAANLPAYSSSTQRHWRVQSTDNKPQFVAIPVATSALSSAPSAIRIPQSAVPLNAEAGLLCIRRHTPFSLEDYTAFLGGRPWKGAASGRETYILDAPLRALSDWDSAQQNGLHLFSTGSGRAGRFIESFHLKLALLHQAIHLVRAAVKKRQLPFLNLAADSFRVALATRGTPDTTLPALWTARLSNTRAGQAIALPIKTAATRYFMALEQPSASVYRPSHMGQPIRGTGAVRIRRVYTDTGDRVCIEGTLVTHDRVGHSASDILWLRLPLPGRAIDLFANLDTAEGLASGEARFRTIPQDLDPQIDEALRSTEGAVFPDTPFETIPLLSTPADLYSLGVLGAFLLLVNSGNTLGVATDDLIGFARKLAQEIDPKTPGETLAARALRIANADPRIRAALGPQRLAYDGITADEASAWLPPDLWWQVLATLARYFPGVGPDSYCKDFGDASPFNLEKAFDAPLRDLDNLLIRTRGLIISDWSSNREVARVIHRVTA